MNEWAIERMSMDGEGEREREQFTIEFKMSWQTSCSQHIYAINFTCRYTKMTNQVMTDILMDVDKFDHDLVMSRNDGWEGYPLKWPLNSSWSS